jgi:nicotinamidase-related amidase
MAVSTPQPIRSRSLRGRNAVSVPVAGTALLLIDVINDLAFEGSEALVAQAEPMASRLAVFARRAGAVGVPTIYVNDNFGQWRSDFRARWPTARPESPGPARVRTLAADGAGLLRSQAKALGFFDTTLDSLLERCASAVSS